MKIKNLLLVAALLVSNQALAEIREAQSMKEILSVVTPDTAVIFDLDNTVIEPYQTIGTDQFFGFLKQGAIQTGMADPDALKWAIDQVTPIAPAVPVRAVEALTPRLISFLQSKNVMTFALTARPPIWARGTLEQLGSVGVNFTKTSPMNGKVMRAGSGSLFAGGVLFMALGNQKGPTLLNFLNAVRAQVTQVVFVDDRLPNIQSVEQTFKRLPVANVNFRYGGADETVKAFDPNIAKIEWSCYQSIHKIISDTQAESIASGQTTCN